MGFALCLTACGGEKTAEQPTPTPKTDTPVTVASETAPPTTQNANQTRVRVVTSPYAPFITKDKKGLIIGFDVDILQEIGKEEGLELEIVSRPWSEALDTLSKNQSDMVISAVTPSAARLEKFSASNSYVSTPNSIAVLEESPIMSINDLKGKTIGLEAGSSFLAEKGKYAETSFKEFETSYLALKNTFSKKVDGVVAHRLHLQYLIKDTGIKVRFIDLPTNNPDKVMMLKKGDAELTQKINSGLDKVKASGKYDEIYKKWFGDDQSLKVPADKL